MHVYRLQTADGRGPYTIARRGYAPSLPPSYLLIEREWNENPHRRDITDPHPSPSEDGLERTWPNGTPRWSCLDHGEYCGFESLDQLRAWFLHEPHDAQALTNMGLLVTVWKVHGRHVRKGGKQVVFYREKAELIDSYPPTKLPG